MKALILAAGSPHHPDDPAWLLQPLGDRALIDYVVERATTLVAPDHLLVVIEQANSAVAAHFGDRYRYVVQGERRGTGHAVLQAERALAGYEGPLLILYGDTVLLRRSSLLGLVTRHQLKQADMTLLAATTDQML
ncbi:MAG: glucosamine-1-phosphate N-acetyltransferase, partial [Chloroflexi bacterium]